MIIAIIACAIGCRVSVFAADQESESAGEDSSAWLPEQYAKDYLISGSTVSPDKKFAVIYPTLEAEEAADNANHPERIKDHIVALEPFGILGELKRSILTFKMRIMAGSALNGRITARWR